MKKLIAQKSTGIVNKAIPYEELQKKSDYGLAYYLSNLWQTIVILGGLALLLYLVWGAIDWLMSEGDQQKLTDAKNKITHALLGMTILAASLAIMLFLNSVFDMNLLQPTWPTAPGHGGGP